MKSFGILFASVFVLGACSSAGTTPAGGAAGGASDSGAGGGITGAGGTSPGTTAPKEAKGCGSTKLLEVPSDTALPGPWPVGVKTVTIGTLKVEIWYPAKLGSDKGGKPALYDIREWLPESEKAKVTDAKEGPPQGAGGFRDLPMDDTHGPYPVVIHLHGTAAFRAASGPQTVQWASRGFIVVAADHPGLFLGDQLAAVASVPCTKGTIPTDQKRDADAMIAALTNPTGELAFLAKSIDMTQLGIVGHSAGAAAAAGLSDRPNVKVVMPLADSAPVKASSTLKSVLILAGQSDTVIKYSADQAAYASSPVMKRLVGIANAGHLVPTELCGLRNPEGKDLVTVGNEVGICGMNLANFLWDCHPEYIAQKTGDAIVNYVTTAVLEETLHCADRTAQFAALKTTYPDVAEFLEQK
jgi:alpha-beta hydrolase superfamily lysophospholipase